VNGMFILFSVLMLSGQALIRRNVDHFALLVLAFGGGLYIIALGSITFLKAL